jgi:hypothetical protein
MFDFIDVIDTIGDMEQEHKAEHRTMTGRHYKVVSDFIYVGILAIALMLWGASVLMGKHKK